MLTSPYGWLLEDLLATYVGLDNTMRLCALAVCYVVYTDVRHWAYGKIPCAATTFLVLAYLTGYVGFHDEQWSRPVHCCIVTLWLYIMCVTLIGLLKVHAIHTGDIRLLTRVQTKLRVPLSTAEYSWAVEQNTIDNYNAHGAAVFNVAGASTQ